MGAAQGWPVALTTARRMLGATPPARVERAIAQAARWMADLAPKGPGPSFRIQLGDPIDSAFAQLLLAARGWIEAPPGQTAQLGLVDSRQTARAERSERVCTLGGPGGSEGGTLHAMNFVELAQLAAAFELERFV